MKWRWFAEQEFPRVVRDLSIPCATSAQVTGITRCPRHRLELGKVTRTCLACHDEVWTEVGRRYASAEQGRTGRVTRRKPTDAPVQLELFGAPDEDDTA